MLPLCPGQMALWSEPVSRYTVVGPVEILSAGALLNAGVGRASGQRPGSLTERTFAITVL